MSRLRKMEGLQGLVSECKNAVVHGVGLRIVILNLECLSHSLHLKQEPEITIQSIQFVILFERRGLHDANRNDSACAAASFQFAS